MLYEQWAQYLESKRLKAEQVNLTPESIGNFLEWLYASQTIEAGDSGAAAGVGARRILSLDS